MAIDKIITSSIADDAVDNTKLDLTSNYNFTGSVTGAGGGITQADFWVCTSDFSGDNDPISGSWARLTASGLGYLGGGMTESSGIFTFPETGIYRVRFEVTYYAGAGEGRTDIRIKVTTDNSNYNDRAVGQVSSANSPADQRYETGGVECFVDVTNTTNVKVRFRNATTDNGNQILTSGTTAATTYANFIRLGDT